MASSTSSSVSTEAKVNVAVRVRPLIQREKDANETPNWFCDSHIIQQCHPVSKKLIANSPLYAFDFIFGDETNTKEVYQKVVAPIVQKSFQGFNGTVLCYGQTSSGKTHTLYGNDDDPGIISLTAVDLFNRIQNDKTRQYYIRIGLLEVYNEKVSDLLNGGKPIEIKEVNGLVVPKDLTQLEILSAEDMLEAAKKVQSERKIGETRMNKESSRSHTILRILIESVPDKEDDELPLCNALLNFVDLAGSEKAGQTGAVGERFKEATFINKSLSTLSQVVMQLSGATNNFSAPALLSNNTSMNTSAAPMSTSKQQQQQQPKYVNFRDSKLTRILQSSLQGNAFIAMVCNITPVSIDETHSTLRFAKTAKKIKIEPTQNQGPVNSAQYKNKIMELENLLYGKSTEVDRLKKQLVAFQKFQNIGNLLTSGNINMIDRRKTCCPVMLKGLRNESENQLLSSSSSEFDLKLNSNQRRISIGDNTNDLKFNFKRPELPIDFRRNNNNIYSSNDNDINETKGIVVDDNTNTTTISSSSSLPTIIKVDAQTETDDTLIFNSPSTTTTTNTIFATTPPPASMDETKNNSGITNTISKPILPPRTPLKIKVTENYLRPIELEELSMDWKEERSFLKNESECAIEDLRTSVEEVSTLKEQISVLQALCDEYKLSSLNNEHLVNELNVKLIQQQQEAVHEVEELKEENSQLHMNNTELKSALEDKETNINRLQFENQELMLESSRAKEKLNNFQNLQDLNQESSSLIDELQCQIEKQKADWEELNLKMISSTNDIASLNLIIEQEKKINHDNDEIKDELNFKLEQLKNELKQNQTLQVQLQEANQKNSEENLVVVETHKQTIHKLEQQISQLHEANQKSNEENQVVVETHKQTIHELEQQISQLQESATKLVNVQEENFQLKTSYETLKVSIEEQKDIISKMEETIEKQQVEKDDMNSDLQMAAENMSSLNLTINQYKNIIEENTLMNEELKLKLDELTSELKQYEDLKIEFEQSKKSCEEYKLSIESHVQTIHELNQTICELKDVNSGYNDFKEEYEKLNTNYESLKTILAEKESTMNKLIIEKDQLITEQETTNMEIISKLQLEIQQLEKDSTSSLTKLKDTHLQMSMEYETLKQTLNEKENTIEELQKEISKEQNSTTTIISKLETAIQNITSLNVEIDEYKKTSEENQVVVETHKQTIHDLEQQMSQLHMNNTELKSALEDKETNINRLQFENQELMLESSRAKEKLNNFQNLQDLNQESSSLIDELQCQIEKQKADWEELNLKMISSTNDIASLNLIIEQEKKINHDNDEIKDELNFKLEQLTNELKQNQTLQVQLQEANQKISEENQVLVETHKQTIHDLEQQISQLQESASNLVNVQEENSQLKTSYETLKVSIEEQKDIISKMEETIEKQQAEKDDMNSDLQMAAENINSLNLTINELKTQSSKLQHTIEQYEFQVSDLLKKCDDYQSSMKEHERLLEETKDEIVQLQNTPSKFDYLSEENFKLEMTCAELKTTLEEKDSLITELQKEMKGNKDEGTDNNKEMEDIIRSLNITIDEYKKSTENYENTIQELNTKIIDLEKELKQYENLSDEFIQLMKICEDHEANVENNDKIINELNNKILEQQQQSTSSFDDLKGENTILKTQHEDMKEEMATLKSQYEDMKEENNTLKGNFEELEKQVTKYKSTISRLETSIEEQEEEKNRLELELEDVKLQIDTLKGVINDHQIKDEHNSEIISNLQVKIDDLQKEMKKLEHEKSEMSSTMNEKLKSYSDNYEQQMYELKLKISQQQQLITELEDLKHENLHEVNLSLEDMKATIEEKEIKLKNLQNQNDELTDECIKLRETIKELESQYKSIQQISSSQIEELQEQLQNYETNLKSKSKELEEEMEKVSSLSNLIEEQEKKLNVDSNEREKLQSKVVELECDLKQYKDQKNELIQLTMKCDEYQIDCENKQKEISQLKQVNESQQQSSNIKLEDLKNEKIKLYSDCEKFKKSIQEQVETIKNLEQQIKVHEDINDKLQIELQITKEQIPQTRPRVSLRSIASQTSDSIDPMKYIQELKIFARQKQQLLATATTEFNTKDAANKRTIKELEDRLTTITTENENLKSSICYLAEEKEELKKYKMDKKEMVEQEVQCDIIRELLDRTKRGENIQLPRGFPDYYKIQKENNELKGQIAPLLAHKELCKCKTPYHSPSTFSTTSSSQVTTNNNSNKVQNIGQSNQKRYGNLQNIPPNNTYAPYQMARVLPKSTSSSSGPSSIISIPPLQTEYQNIQPVSTRIEQTRRDVASTLTKPITTTTTTSSSGTTSSTIKPKLTRSIFDEPPKSDDEWVKEMERMISEYPAQNSS